LSYFLSPFADAEVSLRAYGIIPHLGLSLGYEAELIKRIDPDVASFNSAYRFRFSEREPLPSIIPGLLFNNFLPRGMQSAFYELASARTTDRWENLYDPRGHSQECLGAVESFNLPLSVRELVRRTDLGPLVFAMGHLLITFNGRITVR